MNDHLEFPQLCEAAEGRGEARQPRTSLERSTVIVVNRTQRQLLEAPRKLPEGRDVGLGSVEEDALDNLRAHPAKGDDGVPQRPPERLFIPFATERTHERFG